jgi:hypothetical protein
LADGSKTVAGPVAVVLIKHPADDILQTQVASMIGSVSSKVDCDDFWVTDTSSLGGRYVGEPRPFLYWIEAVGKGGGHSEYGEAEVRLVAETFSITPCSAVGFAAMCNADHDHRILGELAYALAKKLVGVVDYCGSLNLDPERSRLAGQLVSQPSSLHPSEVGRQFSDAEFLRDWMAHSMFYMVK